MEGDFMLPILADKHRVMANKKGSVVVTSDNKFLNENDSQNSNSYGNLPKANDFSTNKIQGGVLRDHRGSVNPRVISKVRGDKVLQVYQQ